MITVRRNVLVLALNAICIVGVLLLVGYGKVSWREAAHFLGGLVVPSAIVWRGSAPEKKDVVSSDLPK